MKKEDLFFADSLRVFAAILIFLCHVCSFSGNSQLVPFGQIFNVGVEIFFVLSGFLFGYKGNQDKNVLQFYIKRAKRLYLPYFLYLIVVFVFFLSNKMAIDTQKWFLMLLGIQGDNAVCSTEHTWFITAILLCYLITPWLSCFAKTKLYKTQQKLWKVLLLLVPFVFLLPLDSVYSSIYALPWFSLAYLTGNEKKIEKKTRNTVCIVVSMAIILVCSIVRLLTHHFLDETRLYNYLLVDYLQFIMAFGFLYLFINLSSLFNNHRIIKTASSVSYEFYLCHCLFISGFCSVFGLTNIFVFDVLIALALSLISALLLHDICVALDKSFCRMRINVWKRQRNEINKANRARLNDIGRQASIISCNCVGGIISHDLGLRFLSPTINMFMNAEDFIRFCENLEHYLSIEFFQEQTDANSDYPIALLDDITLHLVHFKSVHEAQDKWNERKKRINWDNVVIFGSDRDGMTDELKNRFEQLPYKKVMFTHVADESHQSCFKISGYEEEDCVGIVTEPRGHKGLRPVDEFDYVCLLNGGEVNV